MDMVSKFISKLSPVDSFNNLTVEDISLMDVEDDVDVDVEELRDLINEAIQYGSMKKISERKRQEILTKIVGGMELNGDFIYVNVGDLRDVISEALNYGTSN